VFPEKHLFDFHDLTPPGFPDHPGHTAELPAKNVMVYFATLKKMSHRKTKT